MDTSLDQFIKDRKIKFPGRGGRGGGSRNNSRGRSNFNSGRGGRGRSFNRGSFSFQQRGMRNYNNQQRNFSRQTTSRNSYAPQMQQRSNMMFQKRQNFGGFRRNQGQMNFRGRGGGSNRQNYFGGRSQQSFGVMRGGINKREQFSGRSNQRFNTPTKLYISNLDFGVSNQDIKELFSEFGRVRRFGVNFGQNGKSLGTAEVQYENRASAIRAVQKYNNVPLDGRPMKLAISGDGENNAFVSSMPTVSAQKQQQKPSMRGTRPMNRGGVTKKLVQRSKMTLLRGGYRNNRGRPAGGINRGLKGSKPTARRGMTRGRGGASARGGKKAVPTQAQLDAELDAFNAKTD